jgi:hypothetical protein
MRIPLLSSVSTTAWTGRFIGARTAWLCVAAMLSAVGSGCATTKAAAVIEGPPLAVSPPPPRVIVPPEEEPLAVVGNGLDTPLLASPPRVQPSPMPRARTAPARAETEPRSETQGSQSAGAVGPSPSAEPPKVELRAVPSSVEPAVDQATVVATIEKTNALLKNVDPNKLSKENRGIYELAKGYVTRTNEKLKERNLALASVTAEKALQLAQSLTGR